MANRLVTQRSPYLRQHAHNPVDWYPWGPEALERARKEDRPILLSIGYSACHWCHVMERESFDDPGTAEVMNRDFVNIKVDREERPDLDGIYMKAVQALTGQGGWPLTAFLTPEGVPFHGGTYFPPAPRHGMPSFRQVLDAVRNVWENRRDEVVANARRLREALERSALDADPGPEGVATGPFPGRELEDLALRQLASRFDPAHGGFGTAPKFPQPVTLEFLLAMGTARGEPRGVEMVVETLRAMARGGIRDHLGGGFHRYAVDRTWLVPHFEKMLYDNALLARLYLNAWQATGHEELRQVAEETLDYVLGDLRDPSGGFHAARDADSEGEEGIFYLWTPDQVKAAARDGGVEDSGAVDLFMRLHDVTAGGNFEGRSILHLPVPPAEVARSAGMTEGEMRARLAPVRRALLEAREGREHPFRDEKVICAWSAMTVRTLAEAGAVLGRRDYLDAAVAGGRFLLDTLRREDGGLDRIWMEGDAGVDAFLEDWSALGNACLALHEATLDPAWLTDVEWSCRGILDRFWDPEGEVFQDVSRTGERLVVRARDLMDNATPSGNSLAVELLLRAGHLLGRAPWSERARGVLAREAGVVARFPSAFGRLLTQLVREGTAPLEVAVLGPPGEDRDALHRAALADYRVERIVSGGDPDRHDLTAYPLLRDRGPVEGAPAAYVCRRFACQAPVTSVAALETALSPEA